MIAVLGGLGAALFFAIATVSSSRSSRMVGPPVVLAWVVLVGSIVVAPAVVIFGFPVAFTPETLGWLSLSGGGNLVGLLLGYAAMQVGKVGLVAPIASTEGAIAALIAVAAGEPLSASVGIVTIVIAVGVVLTAIAPDDGAVAGISEGGIAIAGPPDSAGGSVARAAPPAGPSRRAIVLAVAAAFAFGTSLYATGRIGSEVPLVWALVPARLFGLVALHDLAGGARSFRDRPSGRAVRRRVRNSARSPASRHSHSARATPSPSARSCCPSSRRSRRSSRGCSSASG